MPSQPARRALSVAEWEELADLYDQHNSCEEFDSQECLDARLHYNNLVSIYYPLLVPDGSMSLDLFRRGMNERCRKNSNETLKCTRNNSIRGYWPPQNILQIEYSPH